MPVFTDPTGRKVLLSDAPQRIISLVPSQTELLYDLGLDEKVIGITKFCVHPEEWFRTKTRIGGTKDLSLEKIVALQPDLIIANKEENVKEQVESLAEHFPVWVTDVNTVVEAYDMIKGIGEITGTSNMAKEIIKRCQENLQLNNSDTLIPACYLIWRNPYMTVGGDTFISDMMCYAGFQNIYSSHKRYPEITIEQLKKDNCQYLLLSSEPYPFKQEHVDELQQQLPNTKILLVDGEGFSWYGSRMASSSKFKKFQ